MIPDKIIKTEAKENVGTFSLFDIEHFLRRVLRNWYWFLLMGLIGYGIAYFYSKYYAQRVYASSLTLSISNNTSSYFTPNQSINFIWGQGGNQDGVLLKKLLLSRTHNEYLVNELDLYTNYTTKGLIKETYLDKYDSPILLEIDKNHLQQVNYPITFIPKGKDRYEVVLPAEGQSLSLYNYKTESMQPVQNYARQQNKVISIGEWYEAPNLKFKLNKNPSPSPIIFQNIIVSLSTVNDAVNTIINTLSIEFDKEINSMMVISKKGYNLNGTVNFLNISVDELIKKRLKDQNV
ncbi:MAG: gliding motility protein, partial [Bacteroidetes bacterium]|nr:gliding motility protein [Bacteroidota bacterium]